MSGAGYPETVSTFAAGVRSGAAPGGVADALAPSSPAGASPDDVRAEEASEAGRR